MRGLLVPHIRPGGGRLPRAQLVGLVAAGALLGACAPSLEQRETAATAALQTLRAGAFDEAGQEAARVIDADPHNPYALLVAAMARYHDVMHQLYLDGQTMVASAVRGAINDRYLRYSLEQAEAELAEVEVALAEVSEHPRLTLDLCLACWERDWNHSGSVDAADRLLFQIEQDAHGTPIPEGDPRRTPTFRFDHGDIYWARAFVAFQRAAMDIVLAYNLEPLNQVVRSRNVARVTIPLQAPERIAAARARILEGLNLADRSRLAYLGEVDDEREWLPNPRQRQHPLPLPVDDRLYQTWAGVIDDVRRLVQSEQGLSVAEVAQMADPERGRPLQGYIDIGRLLSAPRDITLDIEKLDRLEREHDVEGILRHIFDDCYVDEMETSPLTQRLMRMQSEVERGEESFDRKLRYLLWLN